MRNGARCGGWTRAGDSGTPVAVSSWMVSLIAGALPIAAGAHPIRSGTRNGTVRAEICTQKQPLRRSGT